MSFLQPAVLIALPVIALPIIIHLINQRRFHTVQWAAMQFLLAANRMSRGYARLRQWFILAARTLAVAGLIFAISRPLSSGWLAIAGGGQVDTTIILLDRSPSMTQMGPGGVSKLQAGRIQLARSLSLLRSNRYVLIDSASGNATEIDSPESLLEMADAMPVSRSADLPAMLETTEQYIRANQPSRCEVWICSDVRQSDWQPDSGRWDSVRQSLRELPQFVRFHLLAYPEAAETNRSLRLTSVRRVQRDGEANLLLSFRIDAAGTNEQTARIPVQLELDGARSEFEVEFDGNHLELVDHVVPLDSEQARGWGRVSIPADASPSDNEFFFVYDRENERRTLVVTEDPSAAVPLELAASLSADPLIAFSATTLSPDQVVATSTDGVALVLWQAPIPSPADPAFPVVQHLLSEGGQAIFFPPTVPDDTEVAGIAWTQWHDDAKTISTWVGDQGLLSNTRSGSALPLGELQMTRHCGIRGDRVALATLDGGHPLLARAMTDQNNVYFCTTTAAASDSSLASNGIVLYAMIQRAIEQGAKSLGNTQQLVAGQVRSDRGVDWERIVGNPDALSNAYPLHAGIYRDGEKLVAINRSEAEDSPNMVPRDRVDTLFDQLEFDRVDDQTGSSTSLVQEIWRLFLFLMLVALIVEAILCIPRKSAAPEKSASSMPQGRAA